MPIYPFCCEDCTTADETSYIFECLMSFAKAEEGKIQCPQCNGNNTTRMIGIPSMQMGLTLAQKKSGVKNSRLDSTKYMKDAREKRKREFSANTYEGSSNELWTGSEVQRGVFTGPSSVPKSKK